MQEQIEVIFGVWFRAVERNDDDQREQGQATYNRISNNFVSANQEIEASRTL